MTTIGKRIRYYRKNSGLTMNELAEKIGLSQSAISLIENDKRSVNEETLEKIADELKVPIHILTDTEGKYVDDTVELEPDDETVQQYRETRKKSMKSMTLQNEFLIGKLIIETEPNKKLTEIEDPDERDFLTKFHNRAFRAGIRAFFSKYNEEMLEFIRESYREEAELIQKVSKRVINDSNNNEKENDEGE